MLLYSYEERKKKNTQQSSKEGKNGQTNLKKGGKGKITKLLHMNVYITSKDR